MSVTANFSISFGTNDSGGASGHLSAEVDGRSDGLNAGKTSFLPGDTAHFLVYSSDNVSYDSPIASSGSISSGSEGISVVKETDIQFADSDTATLQVPAQSIQSVTWMGTSLGDLSLVDSTTVKAGSKGVAVARVKYSAQADAWALNSPSSVGGLTDFSILVFIQGYVNGA